MKNTKFNTAVKLFLMEMLKENNITINHLEEQHDLYSDTYNISITCLDREKGESKDE